MGVALIVLVQQLHLQLLVEEAREDVLPYLSVFDKNDVQAFLGVGASRGRQAIPMAKRLWERVGRFMPSRTFHRPVVMNVRYMLRFRRV